MKTSLRIKFSIFLVILLGCTVLLLTVFTLKGIRENQVKEQESYLYQQLLTADRYIKEMSLVEGYDSVDLFIQDKGAYGAKQLSDLLNMNVALYDITGAEIGNSY